MDLISRVAGTHARFFPAGTTLAGTVGAAVSSRSITGNVVTVVFATPHLLSTGTILDIAGFTDTFYNAVDKPITVVNATTITYALTHADVATNPADLGGTFTFNGIASTSNRPSPNDAGWLNIGDIEESSDSLADTEIEAWAPKPAGGRLQLKALVSVKEKLTHKFTSNDVGPLTMQIAYRTLGLTSASTSAEPLGGALNTGWLELKRYDQNDLLFQTLYVYVNLKISGDLSMGGSDFIKPQYEASSLKSSQNLMVLVAS